ncbi:hypothetical protein KCU67_g17593, partial [Aureobasidium melanogenum]
VRETTDAIGPDIFPGMVARAMEKDEHEGEAYQSQMRKSSLAEKAGERRTSRGLSPFWLPGALTPGSRSTSFSMESPAPARRGRTQEQPQENVDDKAKVDDYIDYIEPEDQKNKTYSSRDSHVVTHRSTNLPFNCLCMAERTGCPVFS